MTRHPDIELQEALDGRLDSSRLMPLELHLSACEECRRTYQCLRSLRAALVETRDSHQSPMDLTSRVRAALDAEDRRRQVTETSRGRRLSSLRYVGRAVSALAAGLIVILNLAHWSRSPTVLPEIAGAAARDFASIRQGSLTPSMFTPDVKELERQFSLGDLGFEVRVFDLGMMGFDLVGGRIDLLDGRRGAFIVYHSTDRTLLCVMFRGSAADASAGAEIRRNRGREFFVHRHGGMTLVFWQEGDVTCALVSDADPEAVVELAFAKAAPHA